MMLRRAAFFKAKEFILFHVYLQLNVYLNKYYFCMNHHIFEYYFLHISWNILILELFHIFHIVDHKNKYQQTSCKL